MFELRFCCTCCLCIGTDWLWLLMWLVDLHMSLVLRLGCYLGVWFGCFGCLLLLVFRFGLHFAVCLGLVGVACDSV